MTLVQSVKSSVRLFADDTALYRAIKIQQDTLILQENLDTLERWETEWQMAFNVEKCHLLRVTKKKKPINSTYTLHGQNLTQVDSAKYLGVEISKDLHWGNHINAIASKANRTSAYVYRNICGCPHSIHTACYKSLIRPTLEYASPVWDPHQKYLTDSLEKVQRRSARRITGDFSTSSSASEILARLELPPLKERRTTQKATTMYKIVNGLVEMELKPGTLSPTTHSSRGHSSRFHVPQSRTDTHLHSFFPSSIRLWNSLPQAAVNAPTPSSFKTEVESWLRM